MKQKPLLLVLAGAFSCLVFSSYENGPAGAAGLNRTGSAGSGTNNCSVGGCHAANNPKTDVIVDIMDGSTLVTSYQAGKTYTVRITGANSAGLPKFGFQMATVVAANPGTQAGTITAGTGTAVRNAGAIKILEHTAPISGAVSGGVATYSSTATWVAPTAGTGAVKIYITLNAVNGDNAVSGDQPNHAEFTISEAATSVANTFFGADIKAYPNPATTVVNLQQANAANGIWTIDAYNAHGIKIAAQQIEITNGTMNSSVNTASWAAGIYYLQLSKDGQQKAIPVVIQ